MMSLTSNSLQVDTDIHDASEAFVTASSSASCSLSVSDGDAGACQHGDNDTMSKWPIQSVCERLCQKRQHVTHENYKVKNDNLLLQHNFLRSKVQSLLQNLERKQTERARLNNVVRAKDKTIRYLRDVLKRSHSPVCSESLSLSSPGHKRRRTMDNELTRTACMKLLQKLSTTIAEESELKPIIPIEKYDVSCIINKCSTQLDFLLEQLKKKSILEEQLRSENSQLSVEKRNADKMKKEATEHAFDLKLRLETAELAQNQLQKRFEEANMEIEALKGRLVASERELHSQTSSSQATNVKLASELKDAVFQSATVRKALKQANDHIDQLETDLSKANMEIEALKGRLISSERELHSQTNSSQAKNVKLASELKDAVFQSATTRKALKQANDRIDQLETDLSKEKQKAFVDACMNCEAGPTSSDDEQHSLRVGALTQMVDNFDNKIKNGIDDDGDRVQELMAKARTLLEERVNQYLREKFQMQQQKIYDDQSFTLAKKIEYLQNVGNFPKKLIDSMHDVRRIGNGATHRDRDKGRCRSEAENFMLNLTEFDEMFAKGRSLMEIKLRPATISGGSQMFSKKRRGVRFS